ncbi:MAG: FecR domain-containing protein [Deltaproteobacteria bacterium]|nr:FecR domain-containing protein [Deltaproteobacteria bacterium]
MRHKMDEPLVHAFVARAEREFDAITQEQLDHGWQRLRQARAAGAPVRHVREERRLRLLPWVAGFTAAGLVALLGILGYRAFLSQPLRYTVEGSAAREGNAITASPHAASRLLFSDDSRIVLGASTRLTVDGVDARGARIGLLDGAIDVFVRARANGSWRFLAGPFLVRVQGTAFHLAFASSRGRLALQTSSGQVEVFAPPGRTVAVGPGESLELFATPPPSIATPAHTAATRDRETTTSAADARLALGHPRAAVESPRRRGGSPPVGGPPSSPAGSAGASPTTPPLAWTEWLSQGKFSRVVADAERRGIDEVIAQAGPADMAALADAARYIKRYSLSRQVLLAMRSRFAATESAKDASFFLGRLAEATSGAESALKWYDTYLREAPRGLYTKEAMGREMRLRGASSQERARQIARQYLERFPQGPEADLARSLVGSSAE